MIKLIVCGASGRMGQEILKLVSGDKKVRVVAKVDSVKELGSKADVLVDFTHASEFSNTINWCKKNKVACVSGTTGITGADKKLMKSAAKSIPIFWAPNMSLGVNFVASLLKQYGVIADHNFKITETHHIHKKDKPSGTALFLKEVLDKAVKQKVDIESIREGDVFGIHQIFAGNGSEEIILEHRALNREVFARGAVSAVKWIHKKKPALYSMKDLI
jgi:4-hydroxy-tetrahydrodipicolinate reductase